MGCKFNPNDFKKIKEEIDMKEEAKKQGNDVVIKDDQQEYFGDHDEEMEGDAENL